MEEYRVIRPEQAFQLPRSGHMSRVSRIVSDGISDSVHLHLSRDSLARPSLMRRSPDNLSTKIAHIRQ